MSEVSVTHILEYVQKLKYDILKLDRQVYYYLFLQKKIKIINKVSREELLKRKKELEECLAKINEQLRSGQIKRLFV